MKLAAPERVEVRIPRRAEFVRLVRMAACTLAAQLDFTYDVMKDIELAVGEACTNAVEHVADETCDEILVRFTIDGEQLAVEVFDRGQGFDPSATEAMVVDGETMGGLGLIVIQQVMDEVDIKCDAETGTCVRMIKHRVRE
ncbi:MAG: ATP-binding protein [Armatimonadota bacterium]|nr:MAG: ATP-binding protein [Armatimonadota bacterium]